MRILLIEDNVKLNESIKKQLTADGYAVDACFDGEDAFYYGEQNLYDLIILDRMLPKVDGLTVLKSLRKIQIAVPVIMVTALNGIDDRIDGLDAGADDYLAKPFAMPELLARIRALLRRPIQITSEHTLTFSDLTLNTAQKTLTTTENCCELSKKESELMEFFIKNRTQTLPRELLISRVWGPDSYIGDGNLDNYISFLRRRLRTVKSCTKIVTIHGVGYRLEDTDVSES